MRLWEDAKLDWDRGEAELLPARTQLDRTAGNVSAGARALQMTRSQLVYWLKNNPR